MNHCFITIIATVIFPLVFYSDSAIAQNQKKNTKVTGINADDVSAENSVVVGNNSGQIIVNNITQNITQNITENSKTPIVIRGQSVCDDPDLSNDELKSRAEENALRKGIYEKLPALAEKNITAEKLRELVRKPVVRGHPKDPQTYSAFVEGKVVPLELYQALELAPGEKVSVPKITPLNNLEKISMQISDFIVELDNIPVEKLDQYLVCFDFSGDGKIQYYQNEEATLSDVRNSRIQHFQFREEIYFQPLGNPRIVGVNQQSANNIIFTIIYDAQYQYREGGRRWKEGVVTREIKLRYVGEKPKIISISEIGSNSKSSMSQSGRTRPFANWLQKLKTQQQR